MRSTHSLLLLAVALAAGPSAAADRIAVPAIPAAAVPDSRIDTKHLQDIIELQRLKGLYFYHFDHRNYDAWRALFTDDARLMVDGETPDGAKTTAVYDGMDKVMPYISNHPEITATVHHGHTPLYAFPSDSEASGIWAMADIVQYGPSKVFYGYGHYRETYRKVNGVWKFTSVHLTRLRTDMVDPTRSAAPR